MKIPDRYWEGKTLLEARLPWLTPGAIEALEGFVQPTHNVLEFGGGGSTLYFADHCKTVTTWEPELSWRWKLPKLLGKVSPKCRLIQDLQMALPVNARNRIKLSYDIVLVDNSDREAQRRSLNPRALGVVGPGGWFILDNYARYPLQFLIGWSLKTYDDPHWDGKGTLIATKLA